MYAWKKENELKRQITDYYTTKKDIEEFKKNEFKDIQQHRSQLYPTNDERKLILKRIYKDEKDHDTRKAIKDFQKSSIDTQKGDVQHYMSQVLWGLLWFILINVISIIFRINEDIVVDLMDTQPMAIVVVIASLLMLIGATILLYLTFGARSPRSWVPLSYIKGDIFLLANCFGWIVAYFLGRLDPLSEEILQWIEGVILWSAILGLLYFIIVFNVGLWKEKKKRKFRYTYLDRIPDNPIEHHDEDRLLRNKFVINMVKYLNRHDQGGYSIGILGEWGTGKSSVFNLIQKYLPNDAVTVNFKPWYFGKDNHDIIQLFFAQLLRELKSHKLGVNILKLDKELSAYAQLFSNVQVRQDNLIFSFQALVDKLIPSEKSSLTELKSDIQKSLDYLDKPIYVFIDDLDRLDPEEVQMILKLVRLVADFRNITYLLALDEKIIIQSLQGMYKTDVGENTAEQARKYMEKFIQLPIYLPRTSPQEIGEIAWSMLQELVEELDLDSIIEKEIFTKNIIRLKYNLRNLKRFLNTFEFMVSMLAKDVDLKDLLLLIMLKEVNPRLYNYIYENSIYFLGQQKEIPKEKVNFALLFPNYLLFVELLKEILPLCEQLWNPEYKFSEVTNDGLKLCNPKVFNRYFQYGLPEKEASLSDIDSLLISLNEVGTDAEAYHMYSLFLDRYSPDLTNDWIQYRIQDKYKELKLDNLLIAVTLRFNKLYQFAVPSYTTEQNSLVNLTRVLLKHVSEEITEYFYKSAHLALIVKVKHQHLDLNLSNLLKMSFLSNLQTNPLLLYNREDARQIYNEWSNMEDDRFVIKNTLRNWINNSDDLSNFLYLALKTRDDMKYYSSNLVLYYHCSKQLEILPNDIETMLTPESELPEKLKDLVHDKGGNERYLNLFSFAYYHMIPDVKDMLIEMINDFKKTGIKGKMTAQFRALLISMDSVIKKEEMSKIKLLVKEIDDVIID